MEMAFSRLNRLDLFDRAITGLKDDHDIKILCNLMLRKLVVLDPEETVRRLDAVAECFQAVLSTKLKENAVKQEVEKAQEAQKDIIRVSVRMQKALQLVRSVSDNAQAPVWKGYWEWLGKDFKLPVQQAEAALRSES